MNQIEKPLTHANCGGAVSRKSEKDHYVCERCNAEAEGVISAAEKEGGKAEEVILCNPHGAHF